MHKKLENDLMSLAHSILQMKNKDDVFVLKEKAQEIYEKLSLLSFVEEYVNTSINLKETKEEVISIVEKAIEVKESLNKETIISEPLNQQLDTEYLELDNEKLQVEIGDGFEKEDFKIIEKTEELQKPQEGKIEQPFDELEEIIFSEDAVSTNFKDDVKDVGERKTKTLEEELEDTIPVDIMANLFEPTQPKSLNDKLSDNISIGLNDRIAFVKNLFNGSQEDFNRVVSQLNTLKTEKEAKKFIHKMVKPDYNWSENEELETRFMEIIERKFA
jgi:hypothetical protein